MIRGYIYAPVEVAEVVVHHPLLVVEGLAFFLLIGTDILRAHGAVLTLDESAPVRLRVRECAVCREERIASSAKPFSVTRAASLPPVLRVTPPPPLQAPPRKAHAHPHPMPHSAPPPPFSTAHPPAAQSYAQTPHPLYKIRARHNARRNARTSASQPLIPAAQSSLAPHVPLLVSPRASASSSPSHARPSFARPFLLTSAVRRPLPPYS